MRTILLAVIVCLLLGILGHVKSIDCKVGGTLCHSLNGDDR